MNKVKFASLVLLGVFSAGCVSSGVVSAQSDENLVNAVIESTDTHDDSAQADIEVGSEKLDIPNVNDGSDVGERTEEVLNTSIDDGSLEEAESKKLSVNVGERDDKSGDDYVYVNNKGRVIKNGNGVGMVKGLAMAGLGASTVGGASFGVLKLTKSSENDEENIPNPEPSPSDPNPSDPNPSDQDKNKEDKSNVGLILGITIPVAVFAIVVVACLVVKCVSKKKLSDDFLYQDNRLREDDNYTGDDDLYNSGNLIFNE